MGYQSTMPTAFEQQVQKLGLDERTCLASKQLREWCERNKDDCYIPEWLLKQWGISVEADVTAREGPELLCRTRFPHMTHRSARPSRAS